MSGADRTKEKPGRTIGFAFALTGVLVLSPTPAHAQDNHVRAGESFRQAQAAYARQDYAAAAGAFELAYDFEPNAHALLNAADAWTRAAQPARAAEDCDRALGMDDLDEGAREYAVARLAELAPRVATLVVAAPTATSVVIDDGPELHPPLRRRIAPGHHRLRFVDLVSGARFDEEIDLSGAETRAVSAPTRGEIAAVPAPVPPPSLPPRKMPHVLPWVAIAGAGVAAGTASVFSALTFQAQSRFNAHPSQSGADVFYRDRAITDVALGVALAAGTTAIVLWLATPSTSATQAAARTPWWPSGWVF